MAEEVVQGRSLEEIKQEWAHKVKLSPEQLRLEVLEKPGFFSHQWKVRLIWDDQGTLTPNMDPSRVIKEETKYRLVVGKGVQLFRPYPQAGETWLKGQRQDKPFRVGFGEQVEFQPKVSAGRLTWVLQIPPRSLFVMAKVTHELPGHYILPAIISASEAINLEQYTTWESLPGRGEIWDEQKLKADLEQLKVIHGFRPECWSEIMAVQGVGEVIVAKATMPVPPEHARIEDFVGKLSKPAHTAKDSVDFFASKVQLVEKGTVLARKVPGRPGVPGKDVFGNDLPVAEFKDVQFMLKKNVILSDDGLEVIASCAGQPVQVDNRTYLVENVYVQSKDVDLATGSIQFPGDVYVKGNVLDGLHVYAEGKLEIKGSVSHAEIRAEKGVIIYQNFMGGKAVVGGKFVVRSKLLRSLSELQEQLGACLRNTAEFSKLPGAVKAKPGQCLKLVLEKQYPELPKLAKRLQDFVLKQKEDELVTDGLVVTVQTADHFLTGLGPLHPQAVPYLQQVEKILSQYVESMQIEIPEKLSFKVNYVQGAAIECGGSFECQKGVYNSDLRIEGDVVIEGVCRGGKISAGGEVRLGELGGSEISSTFVQINSDKRLSVKYCHPNVIIAVGKEIIRIEEACRQLEIYRENGLVQVEKLKT